MLSRKIVSELNSTLYLKDVYQKVFAALDSIYQTYADILKRICYMQKRKRELTKTLRKLNCRNEQWAKKQEKRNRYVRCLKSEKYILRCRIICNRNKLNILVKRIALYLKYCKKRKRQIYLAHKSKYYITLRNIAPLRTLIT